MHHICKTVTICGKRNILVVHNTTDVTKLILFVVIVMVLFSMGSFGYVMSCLFVMLRLEAVNCVEPKILTSTGLRSLA